jgi:hypothetical protein
MPNLGIIASSISGNLWAPGKDFDSIATTTISTSTATISFTSIPQTYRHLQIRAIGRATGTTGVGENTLVSFNSDTTAANYGFHNIVGDGATATAQYFGSSRVIANAAFTTDTTAASIFGVFVTDILDYTNTNKNKTIRTLNGQDQNGSGRMMFNSLLWTNTAAISRIDLTCGAGNFAQYTQIALYGVK